MPVQFVNVSSPDGRTAVVSEHAVSALAARGWQVDSLAHNTAPEVDPAPVLKKPAKSATAAEWRTWAFVQGAPYDEVFSATRDELAAKYGDNTPTTAPDTATPTKEN